MKLKVITFFLHIENATVLVLGALQLDERAHQNEFECFSLDSLLIIVGKKNYIFFPGNLLIISFSF